MKKLLNDPQLYVEQMLEGLVLAHPQSTSGPVTTAA